MTPPITPRNVGKIAAFLYRQRDVLLPAWETLRARWGGTAKPSTKVPIKELEMLPPSPRTEVEVPTAEEIRASLKER